LTNEELSKLRIIDLIKAAIAVFEIGWCYHVIGFTKNTAELSTQTKLTT